MHSFEKKSRLHIALCALSLLAACASDPIGEEAPQPVGEPSRETAATGRLRVKFKQGEVPERIIETRSGLQTGSEPLDRAIAALGVTRMQRVFPIRGLRSNGTIPTTDRCPMPSPEPTSICFGRGR